MFVMDVIFLYFPTTGWHKKTRSRQTEHSLDIIRIDESQTQ